LKTKISSPLETSVLIIILITIRITFLPTDPAFVTHDKQRDEIDERSSRRGEETFHLISTFSLSSKSRVLHKLKSFRAVSFFFDEEVLSNAVHPPMPVPVKDTRRDTNDESRFGEFDFCPRLNFFHQ
jgi:hypothetical protein